MKKSPRRRKSIKKSPRRRQHLNGKMIPKQNPIVPVSEIDFLIDEITALRGRLEFIDPNQIRDEDMIRYESLVTLFESMVARLQRFDGNNEEIVGGENGFLSSQQQETFMRLFDSDDYSTKHFRSITFSDISGNDKNYQDIEIISLPEFYYKIVGHDIGFFTGRIKRYKI